MFSLVVLFTVFLGLVGVLVFLHELHKKWTGSSHQPQLLRDQVERWLESQNLRLPTVNQVINILNTRLLQTRQMDYQKLSLLELLPGTSLPEFKINKVLSQSDTFMRFECDMEWPLCTPGVAVSVLPLGATSPVVCHLQIEWMYAQASVTLHCEDSVLLVSFAHTSPPLMGLSCGVLNQHLDDQDSAKLASSVADGLQEMFCELNLERVSAVDEAKPTLPVVLVSAPEDGPNSISLESGESDGSGPDRLYESVESGGGGESGEASEPGEGGEPGDGSEPGVDHFPVTDVSSAPPSDPATSQSASAEDQALELRLAEESSDEPRPLSPGWRRSSSYEQLTNSLLDTPTDDHVNSHVISPERKALTLSMAGSEAESLYGADDRIPSTLVFEVKDSVRVRHIVAQSAPHANKMRRHFGNAQKLHIYNDHCFVATHLKERLFCSVCKNRISGIFGKQAYVCRDCGLVSHKQCHFRTESLCPQSQVQSMNLIYPTIVSTVSS